VELKVVNYRDLGEAVKAQRGKVVAVDVWATWCKPCMEHFPHLVGLHEKHKAQGLVCMSVSLDMALAPEKAKEKAEKFLIQKKAAFPNYLLEEPEAVLKNYWNTGGPPVWFVFDRQGRRAGKFTSDDEAKPIVYEEIDKLVFQLLQAQP
jgi:thiol-disulfide isomerase/thioredoxin